MANDPSPDLVLAPLNHQPRMVSEWLTVFHLLFVAVDPRQDQSRWIVPTAGRVLSNYEQADCRVAWLVGGDEYAARRLLGHWADDFLTFVDPDLNAVRGFGLGAMPAIVHLGMDNRIVNAVEGWDPVAWGALAVELSRIVGWSHPVLPDRSDPGPFPGAPVKAA